MAAQTYTIFDGTTTGIANGEGVWLRVRIDPKGTGTSIAFTDKLIHFVLTGATLATIKFLTANELTSPMVSAPLQNPKDEGTMTDVSFTVSGSFSISLPSGTYFTAIISGSGSPLPATILTARGEIEAA